MKGKLCSVLLIGLSVLLSSMTYENAIENDWIRYNLKGKVKQIITVNSEGNDVFGRIEKGNLIDSVILEFNATGGQTLEKGMSNRTNNSWRYVQTYSSGILSEKAEYSASDELTKRFLYKYDDSKNLSEVTFIDPSGAVLRKLINKYDSNQNMIEQRTYNASGSLESRTAWTFNDKNQNIETTTYTSTGLVQYRYTTTYNSAGKKVEFKSYNSSNVQTKKETYKYDSSGNLIEETFYYTNDLRGTKNGYKYDTHGSIIEKKVFDEKDLLIRTLTYEIKYDSNNNWTSRVEYANGIVNNYSERKISYY